MTLGAGSGKHAICKLAGYGCVARNSRDQLQPRTNERSNERLLSSNLPNASGGQLHEWHARFPGRPRAGDSIREPGLAVGNAAIKWSNG
jgi:hypothetical protein